MSSHRAKSSFEESVPAAFNPIAPALEYLIDLSQRTILFWDVMRERGNGYREHMARPFRMCFATKRSW